MNPKRRSLIEEFQDFEYRHGYTESVFDTLIAAQLRGAARKDDAEGAGEADRHQSVDHLRVRGLRLLEVEHSDPASLRSDLRRGSRREVRAVQPGSRRDGVPRSARPSRCRLLHRTRRSRSCSPMLRTRQPVPVAGGRGGSDDSETGVGVERFSRHQRYFGLLFPRSRARLITHEQRGSSSLGH